MYVCFFALPCLASLIFYITRVWWYSDGMNVFASIPGKRSARVYRLVYGFLLNITCFSSLCMRLQSNTQPLDGVPAVDRSGCLFFAT